MVVAGAKKHERGTGEQHKPGDRQPFGAPRSPEENAERADNQERQVGRNVEHVRNAAERAAIGEVVVREVLRDRRRSDVFVTSKVLPDNATYKGTIRAAEKSLRRLGLDYLDLYLLHWPGRHPIGETMRAMEDLVAAGKIRFLGVGAMLIGGIWTLVECGFLKGTAGPNQYGPDPLA